MDSNQINIEYKVRKVGRWEIEPNWMGVWFQMNETETSDGVIFMASKDFPTSVKNYCFTGTLIILGIRILQNNSYNYQQM